MVAVEAVYQIEVDVIGLECLELALEQIFHRLLIFTYPDAHLVCQIVGAAVIDFKSFAEDLFRFALVINHSGVKVIDTHVVCLSQQADSSIYIYLFPILWKTHSTKTQTGNFFAQLRDNSAIDHH